MNPATILVIDDEPDALRMLADILESEGHRTVTVSDSRKVVAALRASKPDLVISDIVMPYLNGLDLLDLVRDERPDLPVLLVTSFVEFGLAEKAWEKGATGFLEKPFEPAALLAAVSQALLRTRSGPPRPARPA